MENEEKRTSSTVSTTDAIITNPDNTLTLSSPTQSSFYSPARDVDVDEDHSKPPSPAPRSPAAESSLSDDLSHGTSLSHGSSPEQDQKSQPPVSAPAIPPSSSPPRPPVVNRSVREEPMAVTKVDPGVSDGGFFAGAVEGVGGGRRGKVSLSILRRVKRDAMVKKAALGFRVCGVVFCLISFSVMASDKNKGWALDSFYRYKEFRYCMTVNVMGFVYSAGQAYDLAFHLSTSNYFARHQLRYYFDFAMDQILTYLLMSASSSAATRIEDWESNWGKDKFPEMASASVGMSFVAFAALASSSLISGYALCTGRST